MHLAGTICSECVSIYDLICEVKGLQDSQSWRELLGKIIKDPQEKLRIAHELEISNVTLSRWVSGESNPRPHNLRLLLNILPEYRKVLLDLLPEEVRKSFQETPEMDGVEQEIPSAFYARVMNSHSNLPAILHYSSVCDVVLQQGLKQLDPNHVGMEITIVKCMYPSKVNKVLSLRESVGRGTPPWTRELEQRTLFLGAESLTGYVVTTGRALAIQNRLEGLNLFPVQWVEWEESAMAHPIMLSDQIAGCLLVSSTQPNYFLSPGRQKLVQRYAELLTIAFNAEDFYDLHQIELGRMPAADVQYEYLATFRRRTAEVMIQHRLGFIDAERLVWQQIEEELLEYQIASGSK
jgi:transcriptional regulator with XRE-family HTH domain